MKKVIIIGCPGGGKSTFSRNLNKRTNIPVFHLDMIYHKPDKTTYSKEEFDKKLSQIMKKDSWIIDGNYTRTLPIRLEQCDTVFWLDYPLDVCLKGVEERRGKPRIDMPWIETEEDEEFIMYIKNFKINNVPKIKKILEQVEGKEIHIFTSRKMTDDYLDSLESKVQ